MSLAGFWEVDPPVVVGTLFPKATVSLPLPGFAIEYDLSNWTENRKRASLRMTFEGVEVATHHIDHAFDDRVGLYDPPPGNALGLYTNMASRNDELFHDICWVLDRFVFHPCAHVHPSPDLLSGLKPTGDTFRKCLHEVRFGVGITNPFAALFQYRVNMVLRQTPRETQAAKEKERDRVAGRMREAILNDGGTPCVPAGVLFERMR
jgi:hypothetical protein